MPNKFVVASLWMGDIPYYIGYFTMYNYWGYIEQVPQTVFVLNTKRSVKKLIANICYEAVKIDNKKYYGVQEITIQGLSVFITDRERTLVVLDPTQKSRKGKINKEWEIIVNR